MAAQRMYTGVTTEVFDTLTQYLADEDLHIRMTAEDTGWVRVYSGLTAVTFDVTLGGNNTLVVDIRDRKPFFLSEDKIWEYADVGVAAAGGSPPG